MKRCSYGGILRLISIPEHGSDVLGGDEVIWFCDSVLTLVYALFDTNGNFYERRKTSEDVGNGEERGKRISNY